MHSSSLLVTLSEHLIKLTFSTLESIRNETSFNAIFKTILKMKKEQLDIFQPFLLRKQHALICFEVGVAEPEYRSAEHDRQRLLYYEANDVARGVETILKVEGHDLIG